MASVAGNVWLQAAADLGIKVTAPYVLTSPASVGWEFDALVHEFGSRRGTLVVARSDPAKADAARQLGYGYACIETSRYARIGFIDILREWTWTAPTPAPSWLRHGGEATDDLGAGSSVAPGSGPGLALAELTPELEARFIEQEHRIVRVVQTYMDRKRWPVDDPRRSAARNAVIWRVLAPGTAAVAAGGLVALATLGVLVWQTTLIADQNEFFKEQNQKLQLQIDQQGDQDTSRRRTEIIGVLYETYMGPRGTLEPKANPRTRGEAVLEFVQLERARLQKLKGRLPAYQTELSLTQARLDGLNLDNAELQRLVLVGAFLQNTSFARSDLRGADLRAAMMESTSFLQADLQGANFEGSAALQVSFARSDLRGANLGTLSVRGCEFLGADLRNANLTGLKDWDDRASFRFANIADAVGLDPKVRDHLLRQGAVELADDARWEQFKRDQLTARP